MTVNTDANRYVLPILIGSAALTLVSIAAPRAAATTFMIYIALAIATLAVSPERAQLRVDVNAMFAALFAFAGVGMLSALWSAAPLASLSKSVYALGAVVGTGVAVSILKRASDTVLRSIAAGLVLALVIGGAVQCFETLSNQALTRAYYNLLPSMRAAQEKHLVTAGNVVVQVGENEVNRRATVVTLLLVPALLMLKSLLNGRARLMGLGGVLAIGAVLLGFSAHQSSQAAIAVALIAYVMTFASLIWTRRLIGLAWCASCLLIVPLVLGLHSAGVHEERSGLFKSARHRVVIWNYTAEQVRKAPILGVGADATATITSARDKTLERQGLPKDGEFGVTAARHAHNAFLQTWYELGAVGAFLLAACGLGALAAIARQRETIQPYLLAQFAAVAGMIAFSFSIWQVWFAGAIGLGILALVTGIVGEDRRLQSSR